MSTVRQQRDTTYELLKEKRSSLLRDSITDQTALDQMSVYELEEEEQQETNELQDNLVHVVYITGLRIYAWTLSFGRFFRSVRSQHQYTH